MAQRPQSQRVLMLGASGKLGRMMRAVWNAETPEGVEIVPVFRKPSDCGTGLIWSPGDNPDNLPPVDAVLALWGVTGGNLPALGMNAKLAQSAMELADALGAQRVVHCSTGAVYRMGPDPLKETDFCAPSGAYGAAKLEMEQVIAQAESAASQIIMRIGNVAGAESLFGNMTPGGGIRLDRFDDGHGPERSYIAPQDLARVCLTLCTAPGVSGIYNVAAPMPTAMEDIARAGGCRVEWQDAPEGAIRRVFLDTARLQAVCPMGPETADAGWMVKGARATGIWP